MLAYRSPSRVGGGEVLDLEPRKDKKMDRYLLIELGSEGLAFETAQFDFYASWLGIGLTLAVIVAVKIAKRYRKGA